MDNKGQEIEEEVELEYVWDFEEEEDPELAAKDDARKKVILINSFKEMYIAHNDDSDDIQGYTIHSPASPQYSWSTIENNLDMLILDVTGGDNDLFNISNNAANKTGHTHEQGRYTNFVFYFFSESNAQDWLNNIIEAVEAL